MKVKIIRFTNGYKATLGELYINDEFFCYTLEREWLDNQRRISCIPPGKYSCEPYSSKKYPSVTEITNVPHRDKILIHAGNYYWDIKGCILLGDRYVTLAIATEKRTGAVYNSKKTLNKFFDKVGREFELEIIDNINPKPKKKMALPLLFLATPFIKKLAIKGFEKLKGKALDKVKETVVKKILEKTGIDLGDHLSDGEKQKKIESAVNNLTPEQLLELKKEIIESESELLKAELENQTEQMAIVNRTMKAELKADDSWQRRWRPVNGFCFAITLSIILISFVGLGFFSVYTGSSDMVEMISKLIFSFSPLIGVWSAVLGVSSYTRGKEKLEKLKKF